MNRDFEQNPKVRQHIIYWQVFLLTKLIGFKMCYGLPVVSTSSPKGSRYKVINASLFLKPMVMTDAEGIFKDFEAFFRLGLPDPWK